MTDPTDDDFYSYEPPVAMTPGGFVTEARLIPANRNPWYVLATLHGEQDEEKINEARHKENRAVWNAWSCQNLNDEERLEVAASLGISEEELAAWPSVRDDVAQLYKRVWRLRNGEAILCPPLPDINKSVVFQDVVFSSRFVMSGCVFTSKLSTNNVIFKEIHLDLAVFIMHAQFYNAVFDGDALFKVARFKDSANFCGATFNGSARFSGATFHGQADFQPSTFNGDVSFDWVKFHGQARFGAAAFRGNATFNFSMFGSTTVFGYAEFIKDAKFNRATFTNDAWFHKTMFSGGAEFQVITFQEPATFAGATFGTDAVFAGTTFNKDARFFRATFIGGARFARATFNRRATFINATFGAEGEEQLVSFSDCQFDKPLNFRGAKFRARYPVLVGAITADRNVFTAKPDHWPKTTTQDPEQARESCAAIRHMLDKQGLPEEAHFFFRREMDFAGQIGPIWQRLPYLIYGTLSDYGQSIMRPAVGLIAVIALGWAFIRRWLEFGNLPEGALRSTQPIPEALVLSVANTLPFLGLTRATLPDFHKLAPWWLDLFSAAQSLFGIVLLFLLGLGLRTRFRMR
jgi:uncharacterized protein YjbI with pentapeptide repeats